MPNQEPMIKVQDVRFRYDPEQPKYAVDGVSLDIRRGEFVAVLGANGCGKSTLAKHFNAILLPEAGTVLVEGMDTRNEDHLYDVRQKVGMVFQNPDNQIVATIVEEDVAFAPENLGVPPEEIRTRIDEAMKLAGIYEKREAAPYKLSGGQKQRVAIAGPPWPRAGHEDHPPAAGGGHHDCVHHPLHGGGRPGRPRAGHEPGPHRHGGHARAGVQPDRAAARVSPRCPAGRRAARRAGQGRDPDAGKCHYPRRLRGGIIQAAEIKEAFPLGGSHSDEKLPRMPERHRNRAVSGGKGTTMSEIIRVENLSYIYNQGMPDATKALDDVSFTVEEGDFVGIIGSTGSGKSTLISHFNGLNRPTSGRVLVDGRDLWEQGADLRSFRFLVGLVMQYPEYQLFEETCARDIAYGPRNMGLDEAEVQRRVREAAAFVGLSDELLEKSPFELSGGQKRRVAIAGVMAMHPRVLVLDEPAAGLDPEGRDTILSQIRDYHEKTGITVLLVSHSMEDIAKYANRVLVMHRAKIAMYDTVENVFARAQELLELGLSVPQVTQIFLKLRQMGLDIPADVYTIPYAVKTIQKALAAKQGGGANA